MSEVADWDDLTPEEQAEVTKILTDLDDVYNQLKDKTCNDSSSTE